MKVNLDMNSLKKDDFLLNPSKRSKSEDNVFKFSGDESDEFEDSYEELGTDNDHENDFSAPIPFKSNYGRILARSESRARSKSVSIKRVISHDVSATQTEAKKKKSGLPTARKVSDNMK